MESGVGGGVVGIAVIEVMSRDDPGNIDNLAPSF
jgi:hypothetical protein